MVGRIVGVGKRTPSIVMLYSPSWNPRICAFDSDRPTPLLPLKFETDGVISAIWLKSEVAGSESSISERLTIDCGCFASSEAVVGAMVLTAVAVTTIAEPSAMPPSSSASGAAAS